MRRARRAFLAATLATVGLLAPAVAARTQPPSLASALTCASYGADAQEICSGEVASFDAAWRA